MKRVRAPESSASARASKRGRPHLPDPEPMAVQDIRDALVIRERDMFLLTNVSGEVPAGNPNGYGLYYADTRYISCFELTLGGIRPMVLLSTAELGYSSEHVLSNYRMLDLSGREIPAGQVEVQRTRVLEDVFEETLRVTNYAQTPVDLEIGLAFEADFADIFEVRGFRADRTGGATAARWEDATLYLTGRGAGGPARQSTVLFEPAPDSVNARAGRAHAVFRPSLRPGESALIRMVISLDGRMESPHGNARFAVVEREYAKWLRKTARVVTDNQFFDAVLARSLRDLRMLWNHDKLEGGYPAAGTPWYDTLFGRDTAIVGLQTLWLKPDMARQCLGVLARYQGTKFDDWRDEQPGRILHELRVGDLTRSGVLPFSPYFGSIDSTPLFLLLATEYFRWTVDLELMADLETSLRAAVHWIETHGDSNLDGFIDYEKRSPSGLVNQGWKDSGDAIVHADGRLLEPPIALAEVQGITYAAYRGLAPIFEALGDPQFASSLRARARALGARFRRQFWCQGGYFALALDGEGTPSASVTSNGGQALWSGIALRKQAVLQARRLFMPDMFSGWGIRTLSSESPRFNPQGYHTGTVWPHDNSIIAMGLKRYGMEPQLNRLATALFEASLAFPYYRLPELFGGNPRSAHHSPVPYPVACRPQAWAAGTFPFITQAILGICPDAPNRRLYVVSPELPEWLRTVSVCGLRVGSAEVDLAYERTGNQTSVRVTETRGDVSVSVVRRWPEA